MKHYFLTFPTTAAAVFLHLLLLLGPSNEAVPHSITSTTAATSCDIHLAIINCHGPAINDASLLLLKDTLATHYRGMYFTQLIFSATDVAVISAEVFADVEFESVLVSDNSLLRGISEAAFRAGSQATMTLQIVNNRQLRSSTLYRLADRLAVKEAVDFDSNSLEEVPPFAFNSLNQTSSSSTSTLKRIQLRNNQIKQIRPKAFYQLPAVVEIDLSSNKIVHIARQAFQATSDSLKIHLAHNDLTSASFEADFIELNSSSNSNGKVYHLSVDLSHNAIEQLPEAVFKPLLLSSSHFEISLDLTGNKVTCHSSAWLFTEENKARLAHKLVGVTC